MLSGYLFWRNSQHRRQNFDEINKDFKQETQYKKILTFL